MDPAANAALFSNYVLKDGDSFMIANAHGDIEGSSDGLFHNDTRLLSDYRLQLGGALPALLSATVSNDNVLFIAHLTNRQLPLLGTEPTPHGLIHLCRTRLLCGERMYERIQCRNYGSQPMDVPLTLFVDADFRDMFEVRGSVRPSRGQLQPAVACRLGLRFSYRGLDGIERRAELLCSEAPVHAGPGQLTLSLQLAPGQRQVIHIEAGVPGAPVQPSEARFRTAAAQARRRMRGRQRRGASVRSSTPLFSAWMERSRADLALLTSELETGPYPYAGIPWFSTPFGRDAVITALQTLWLDPGLARGVLGFLARHQAQEEAAFLDAAPGKIMHETRKGEMSATRELPFGRYYGGVDTTPLFVILAEAYAERSDDPGFVGSLWPALQAAIGWIERVCDADPNGLLTYSRAEASGLANQGWKDSHDSVFHADGRFPPGPIALVEVQGYAFAAFRAMAALALRHGEADAAVHWRQRAEQMRTQVEQLFWMPERDYYGIALDGDGQLCRVLSSNAGHLLYVGLPAAERAAAVRGRLLSPAFHSGWGLRTLAEGEANYNPMSYHNGSIWPHDSALCTAGLARYGGRNDAVGLLRAGFETAIHFDMRLPELFCGFPRSHGTAPVPYPVACLPQAWAAGSAMQLLQACLGVSVDHAGAQVRVDRPQLPARTGELMVDQLAVGPHRVRLVFRRIDSRVAVFLEGRDAAEVSLYVRGC
jgi:glycogen debranching enzyme